jgi:hypothetical protein
MINPPCQFSYNPKWRTIVLCSVFFGAGAAIFFNEASNNDSGVIIDNLITLDTHGASTFYWTLFGCSVMFVVLAAFLLLRKLLSPRMITVDEQHISLPHGLLQSKTKRIAYAQIKKLWEKRVSRQTFLYLQTADGKYSIIESLLPNKQSFEEIKDFLISRAPQSR